MGLYSPPMNWAVIGNFLLLAFFGFISLLLIGVVMIQKGRGGGLASAFGGGSGTATAFGSKTGDVLTWATSVIFGIFLLLAIVLNLIANHASDKPKLPDPLAGLPPISESPTGTGGTGGAAAVPPAVPAVPATTQP